MSNYTKTTDFAAKDSLTTGDPNKVIKGTEFDAEFDNLATAVATKADKASPTFTGTVTLPTTDLDGSKVVIDADGDTHAQSTTDDEWAWTFGGTLALTWTLTRAQNIESIADADSGARTTLGATIVGDALFTLTNPSAITFIRVNADNTVTARAAADFLTDLGASGVGANLLKLSNPSAITFPRMNADNTVSALSATDFKTALGSSTVGANLFGLSNPGAITFIRLNADNSVTALSASDFRTAIGTGSLSGTNTWTGINNFDAALREDVQAVTTDIDWSTGNLFTKTISGNTTFTESNKPSSGVTQTIVLEITNGGAFTVAWPGSWTWPQGLAPTLSASGVDVIAATVHNGTNVRAVLSGSDFS